MPQDGGQVLRYYAYRMVLRWRVMQISRASSKQEILIPTYRPVETLDVPIRNLSVMLPPITDAQPVKSQYRQWVSLMLSNGIYIQTVLWSIRFLSALRLEESHATITATGPSLRWLVNHRKNKDICFEECLATFE